MKNYSNESGGVVKIAFSVGVVLPAKRTWKSAKHSQVPAFVSRGEELSFFPSTVYGTNILIILLLGE